MISKILEKFCIQTKKKRNSLRRRTSLIDSKLADILTGSECLILRLKPGKPDHEKVTPIPIPPRQSIPIPPPTTRPKRKRPPPLRLSTIHVDLIPEIAGSPNLDLSIAERRKSIFAFWNTPQIPDKFLEAEETANDLAIFKSWEIDLPDLQQQLSDPSISIERRRKLFSYRNLKIHKALKGILYKDYDDIRGSNVCESVIGYAQMPLGFAGPILINGLKYHVPMATTEGCLVASANRGCRALVNGVQSVAQDKGMIRATLVRMPNILRGHVLQNWIENLKNFSKLQDIFESVGGFVKLQEINCEPLGRLLHLKFLAQNGDTMDMTWISRATDQVLGFLKETFPDMEIVASGANAGHDGLSPTELTEKSGRFVTAEALIPAQVVESILKVKSSELVDLHLIKNFTGASLAGSIGGCNAHAANIVAAIYVATGQNMDHVVRSSNCTTVMELCGEKNDDLYVSVTMPSVECAIKDGGTVLYDQKACLGLLGLNDPRMKAPKNASSFACIVAGVVLAGELSLMAALASGTLVDSHLKLNRRI